MRQTKLIGLKVSGKRKEKVFKRRSCLIHHRKVLFLRLLSRNMLHTINNLFSASRRGNSGYSTSSFTRSLYVEAVCKHETTISVLRLSKRKWIHNLSIHCTNWWILLAIRYSIHQFYKKSVRKFLICITIFIMLRRKSGRVVEFIWPRGGTVT